MLPGWAWDWLGAGPGPGPGPGLRPGLGVEMTWGRGSAILHRAVLVGRLRQVARVAKGSGL
jgi:hypothetical protein